MHRTIRPAALAFAALWIAAACDRDEPPAGTATTAPAPAIAPATADASAPATAAEDASAPADTPAPAPADTSATADASAPRADAGAGDAGRKGAKDAGAPRDAGTGQTPSDAGGAVVAADAGTGDAGAAPALPPAEAGSADAVAASVDAIYLPNKTYSARFKQEHTQKVSGVVKKQTGTVFVEKPNKISFRYDPPNKNRIVSDGTTLKVYVAEDQQMFVSPVQKTEYPGALSFLMGQGLRPSFTFTFNEKAKFEGGPVLLGKPRSPTPYYENVLFYVDKALLEKKDPGVVRRVLIVDAQGNRNRFDFENATHPASIDPAEFQFTPPPGTDVKQNP